MILLYRSAGITVTACPLSDDFSNRHLVEVFSAGWHHKSIFQRHEASPALSVEFLPDIYDFNEYFVTWLELSRRPPVAEGIGKHYAPLIPYLSFQISLSCLQRTVNIRVRNCMHV